jgi:glycosyltransferase involved in cell wall biosynthesis
MYANKKIGVVVPAYNEEKLIGKVVETAPPYVDRIFVIDDSSTDATPHVLASLKSRYNGKLNIIRHPLNQGVGAAIVTGYKACLAENIDVAVVMAGDAQMDPTQLPALLDQVVRDQADYTVGDRTSRTANMKGMSPWRRLGNWLLRWLTRIAAGNTRINDPQNGYTAVRCRTLARLDLDALYPRYGYCNDILVKLSVAGARIAQVPMPAVYGLEKSKIRYRKYIPSVSWLLLKSFVWRLNRQFRKEVAL